MDIIKVCLIVLMVIGLCLIIRSFGCNMYSLLILAAAVFVMVIVWGKLVVLADALDSLLESIHVDSQYIRLFLKMLAVSYICTFISDICKDNGFNTLANQVELLGRVTIVIIALPLIYKLVGLGSLRVYGAQGVLEQLEFEGIDNTLEKYGVDVGFERIVIGVSEDSYDLVDIKKAIIGALSDHKWGNILRDLVGVAILSALINITVPIINNKQIREAADMVIVFYVLIICYRVVCDGVAIARGVLDMGLDIYMSVMPVFMAAVMLVQGSFTYAVYHQLIFTGVSVATGILRTVAVKGVSIVWLLHAIDIVSGENSFSRLANMSERLISLGCRAMLVIFTGISGVKGLMAPSIDTMKRRALMRGVKVIPGLSDCAEVVSQAILGTGIVIKNGVGIAGVIVIIIVCLSPIISLMMLMFMLRISYALLNPVVSGSFLSVLDAGGNILSVLLTIVCVALLMMIIMIGLVCLSTNSAAAV